MILRSPEPELESGEAGVSAHKFSTYMAGKGAWGGRVSEHELSMYMAGQGERGGRGQCT